MRHFLLPLLGLFIFAAGFVAIGADTEGAKNILRVEIKGPITPAAMERLAEVVRSAGETNAAAVLVVLDTPGGLASSMDEMVQTILNSKVPVITFVWPPGAACASAGVYILYASHVAAMAPATNLGSATPVMMGGSPGSPAPQGEQGPRDTTIPKTAGSDDAVNLKRKQINHARAQIRGLAEFHHRNADFAERTVTEAANITSEEAVKIGVIDIVAITEADLLKSAEGRTVRTASGTVILKLAGAKVVTVESGVRSEILGILSNPNVAYILMMIGVLGIMAEIQYPGSIFPGVAGGICLLLGLYAMQTLPVNYAGLGLIFLGIIFFILEIKVVSYGMLTVAGMISVVLGSVFLIKSDGAFVQLSTRVILATAGTMSAIMGFLAWQAARAMKREPASGLSRVLQETGIAQEDIGEGGGMIYVHSELWSARSASGTIPKGTHVRILRKEGPELIVERIPESVDT